jgi:hypothetical protein
MADDFLSPLGASSLTGLAGSAFTTSALLGEPFGFPTLSADGDFDSFSASFRLGLTVGFSTESGLGLEAGSGGAGAFLLVFGAGGGVTTFAFGVTPKSLNTARAMELLAFAEKSTAN